MSAFSTISALRRRRPEGLPEGNAAAGGGLQGVACRERLAGSGSQGGGLPGRLAGSALLGGGLAGGASQGAPRRGRLAGGVGGPPPRPRDVPASGSPLRPAPARSGPLRPDQSGHRATFRPLLPSGHLSASVCCTAAGASPPSGPPALRRCPAASARPQPRNLTTPQPRNPATTQPRSLRNPSATQKGPSPRGESPFASGWRRAPIRGTRAGYRLQRPNRRRRPRWDPWRASAGSCSGPPSAPQSARRGQPSEPPKHRPNQSAG